MARPSRQTATDIKMCLRTAHEAEIEGNTETHLRRILGSYVDYHNRVRTHLSLNKDAPIHRATQSTGLISAIPMLGGSINTTSECDNW